MNHSYTCLKWIILVQTFFFYAKRTWILGNKNDLRRSQHDLQVKTLQKMRPMAALRAYYIFDHSYKFNNLDLILPKLVPIQLGHNLWKTIFKKVHFWVKKRHLIFGTSIPGQILKNCSRAFEGQSYLAYKIQKKIMFSYIFHSHNSNHPFQQ